MYTELALASLVFLSVGFSFSLAILLKFLNSPYSVPLLFFSLFTAFLVVSNAFTVLGNAALAGTFEAVAIASLLLNAFSLYRLFSRVA